MKHVVARTTCLKPVLWWLLVTRALAQVVSMVREHFNCSTLPGMPLEDVRLGMGVHWEARLSGGEFMAYGSASSELFVSDLTFAYLEDTNQYIANYSMGGRMVNFVAAAPSKLGSFMFFSAGDIHHEAPESPALSPGSLRWGKGQGCEYVLCARACVVVLHTTLAL
jgi:hypothetical protein